MLIKNSGDRTARHQEKIELVLQFLSREKWSDFATLNRLFGFKNHRGLYDLLNKLVTAGTLKKHRFGAFRLWSITANDLSLLSAETIRSRLAGQNARFSFEAIGCTVWENAIDMMLPATLKHKPTALVTMPDGLRVALEIHTRMRTQARYKVLVKHHLLARKQQLWDKVVFILSSTDQRNAARLIIKNVTSITINKIQYPLEQVHHDTFQCVTLDELKNGTFELS